MVSFCESVISQKETAERVREAAAAAAERREREAKGAARTIPVRLTIDRAANQGRSGGATQARRRGKASQTLDASQPPASLDLVDIGSPVR